MKSNGIVILRKAEIVLSRQVSSTARVVPLSGIHEWFLGNVEDLLEVSMQRTKVTAAAIESISEFGFQTNAKDKARQNISMRVCMKSTRN